MSTGASMGMIHPRPPAPPGARESNGYNQTMIRRAFALVVMLALLFPAAALRAQSPARSTDSVVAATLDNGLRVLLLEDHRSPIVSFQVWYRVGSRNESRGATGIAHLLEHMLFKGTPKYGPRMFARLVEQNGGQNNAFTSADVTSYYVNIAADKVDLVIDLESDRMQNALLDPKEIDSERQVVIEERRTRTEDDPGGFLGEEVGSLAFKAHPYGYPIIGWMEDIKRITPEEIRAFYKTYYVPNNAIVVAAGDFRAAAGAGGGAAAERRAADDRQEGRAAAHRLPRLSRAQPAGGGRARARGPVHRALRRPRLTPVQEPRLQAARSQRGGRLLVFLP